MTQKHETRRWRRPKVPAAAYLADVFEWAFAGLFIISAISIAQSGFQITASMGVDGGRLLPVYLAVVWAVSLLLAGALMLVGLGMKKNATLGVGIERGGLYLATGAWLSLLAVGLFGGAPLDTLAQFALVSAACFGRSYAIKRIDTVVVSTNQEG